MVAKLMFRECSMRRILVLLSLLAATACAPAGDKLLALKTKNPSGEGFNNALASEYLAYAQSLSEQQHPVRADHFAGKGLDALVGKNVLPEEADDIQTNARSALMEVLTADMKDITPTRTARAQLLFDCWVDESRRPINPQPALCANEFSAVLIELQSVAEMLVHDNDNRYIVRFAPGSEALTDQASAIVNMVSRRVATLGQYQIDITAYANRPQKSSKSKLIARKRALAIEKALIARGVNAGHITSRPHKAESAVFLSVDEVKDGADSVVVTLQTYEQPGKDANP